MSRTEEGRRASSVCMEPAGEEKGASLPGCIVLHLPDFVHTGQPACFLCRRKLHLAFTFYSHTYVSIL